MRLHLALTTAAAFVLAGCGSMSMGGKDVASTSEELVTATATIESVDTTARSVSLIDDETAQRFTVFANDGIKNFDQLDAGDVVVMQYYEATTLSMADPADPGNQIDTMITAETPDGAKPGLLDAASTTLVVEVLSYDAKTGMATFTAPDGLTRRSVVKPEMRSFAANLSRGDRVLVTMVEAVAISIEEVAS